MIWETQIEHLSLPGQALEDQKSIRTQDGVVVADPQLILVNNQRN